MSVRPDQLRALMYCWELFLGEHFLLVEDTEDLARIMQIEFGADPEFRRFQELIVSGELSYMDDREFLRKGDGIHRFTGKKESLAAKNESMGALLEVLDNIGDLVDVGGGKGDLSIFLLKKGLAKSALVVEPSEYQRSTALDLEAKEKSGIRIVSGLMQELPLADQSADTVICVDVLEWSYEPEKGLSEMARVLRPGGKLFITANQHDFRGGLIPFDLMMEVLRLGGVEAKYLGCSRSREPRHYVLGTKH